MTRRSFLPLLALAGVAQWLGPLVAIQGCAGSTPATRSIPLSKAQADYMKKVEKAFEKHKNWGCGAVPSHIFHNLNNGSLAKGVVYCNICNFHLDIEVQNA